MNEARKGPKPPAEADIVVIGAGVGGLYAHYRFRKLGMSVFGFEQAPEVGGTWFWNRYPGARCDVPSLEYNFSFSEELLEEWQWSERYATQPEIERYINHVADRFDLRRDIAFSTKVTGCTWDEDTRRWTVETDRGDSVACRFLVTTVGCLSVPKPPEYPGLDTFEGQWVLTGAWPREPVEMEGKRIAVIGTGSSGIQAIPEIAKQAAQLTVFQRTPNYSVPARNGPTDPEFEKKVRADYPGFHRQLRRTLAAQTLPPARASALDMTEEERNALFEEIWDKGGFGLQGSFRDVTTSEAANEVVAEFARRKIDEIVEDPEVAEALKPRSYPFGTKRLCLDTDYFATYNRDNVELVDLRKTPIERITAKGIETSEREYDLDLIVFATGFDAMTGPLVNLNITGTDGRSLREEWQDGPSSYLGLAISGFPNLFTVNGPSSPSVLTNMIPAAEHHVEWIADCIAHMREHGIDRIEADPAAEAEWAEHTGEVANRTLYPKANSWYVGANVPGKPRVFMAYIAGFDVYQDRCAEIAKDDYAGFRMSRASAEADSPA
jgi:cyclohexanone monooxygenase